MTPRRDALGAVLLALLACAAVHADAPEPPARVAEDAPADTSLDDYLGGMSDSTSAYFGLSAAKPDTAGLDSALAYGLAHPRARAPITLRPSFAPDFAFNRVDGPTYRLLTWIGSERRIGRLSGRAGYASGPNDVLWNVDYVRVFGGSGRSWRLDLAGGEETASMNREHETGHLSTLRAFVAGKDGEHYLRHKGFETHLRRELAFGAVGAVGAGYRDMDESALATTAGWNLLRRPLSRHANLSAWNGHVREIELGADFELHPLPIALEMAHQTSAPAIGSDFSYRRSRVAIGGNLGLGRWASLVPQAAYGRLTGQAVPQASFFLGGEGSMRSLMTGARAGTGLVLGRIELLGATDILEVMHIPHPSMLPIQLGAFVASGAVWGVDPYGGPTRPGFVRPRSADVVSEAGVSVMYQPGLPDPTSFLRLNFTWPLGPEREASRFSVSYSRAMDFLTRFGH